MNAVEQARRRQDYEAYQTGCYGLTAGWAKNPLNGKRFSAAECSKMDGPFMCEACLSDAVHRRCIEKIHHFAHQARHSPAVTKGESELHLACKQEILAALQKEYPAGKWEAERLFPSNPDKRLRERRPDLSGYIEKLGIVIEVQASALSIPQILARMRDYSSRQCFVLWVVPLKDDLGSKPFLPRLYERYFHSIYFGRTYYWRSGDGAAFRPVHYGVASRWIDEREWYDVEEGVEKSAGGYDRPYIIVKRPMEGTQVPLSLKAFQATWRTEFVPWNTRKAVPRCRIMRDKNREWWNKTEEAAVQPDYYHYS